MFWGLPTKKINNLPKESTKLKKKIKLILLKENRSYQSEPLIFFNRGGRDNRNITVTQF